ncbi:MAG TPA: hypothetical protein VGE15_11935 [Sphingobacteriaceae bacterium]
MRKLYIFPVLLILTSLTGCELIGDIFKTGFYAGIFIVIAIILLVFWLLSRIRR